MKIVILNGDIKQEKSDFSEYLEKLTEEFRLNHTVQLFPLNKMNLHYCTGCWTCWWKTPGRCAIHDDAEEIFKSVINSDFFIFASPLIAGFTSSALKKITDRFIVLLHPYIKFINGESHHRKRYNKYPDFGLILDKETDTDNEDLKIISDIYDRLAINFHSKKKYMKFIDRDKPKDIVYETFDI
jgi:multimeric flavodoxin WrbA